MNSYQANLDEIIEKIEKARLTVSGHHIVKLVAVSKYSTSDEIQKLLEVGQRAFGENKVQDLIAKSDTLDRFPIEWHFIGTLQKNKINHLIDADPFLMHSLDSLELALTMDKKLKEKNRSMDMLVQINSAKEASKSGLMPEVAYDTFQEIQERCPNINLKGIMTIGAHSHDTKIIQKSFETSHAIFEKLKDASTTICSMGMSSDYELAIRSGSTMVRIGSALFKK